jgi:hypothetical protein
MYVSGLLRQPKWGHLRDLHRAIKQAEPVLISGDPTIQSIGNYEKVNCCYKFSHIAMGCQIGVQENISRY